MATDLRVVPRRRVSGGSVAVGRDVSVDLVRVVGVVAIVVGHAWPAGWVRDATFPWHVPVFFVLTGYLWHARSWRQEARARATSLLRPYAFWLGVTGSLFVLVLSVRDGLGPALRAQLPDLVWGGQRLTQPFNAYWFITCLFVSCLLYAAADRAGRGWRWALVGLAGVGTVVGGEQLALLPLSAGTALPAVVFIEAGRQLRGLGPLLDRPAALTLTVLALLTTAVAVLTGVMPSVDLKVGDFGTPVLSVVVAVALSAALLVLARRAGRSLNERSQRAVTTAATCLVPVVLLHAFALQIPVPPGGEVVQVLLGLGVPLALSLALARTRLSGWALGH